jgi:hypothetical protein
MADTVEIPEDLQGRDFTPEQISKILRVRLELGALVAKLSQPEDFFSTEDVRVVLESALERFNVLRQEQMIHLP